MKRFLSPNTPLGQSLRSSHLGLMMVVTLGMMPSVPAIAQHSLSREVSQGLGVYGHSASTVSADAAYVRATGNNLHQIKLTLTQVNALWSGPHTGPHWRQDLGASLTKLAQLAHTGATFHAPARYRDCQRGYGHGMAQVESAARAMPAAIDSGNSDKIHACGARIKAGIQDVVAAIQRTVRRYAPQSASQ